MLCFVYEVPDRLHRLAPDFQAFVAVARSSGHAVGEAATGEVALPPFACLQADIPALGEESRQGGQLIHEHVVWFAGRLKGGIVRRGVLSSRRARRVIAGDAALVGIKSGNQRSQTGAAQAGWHVTAPENNALRGEAVKVGRLHLRMPHETVIAPMMVIRNDKNDIGRRRSRGSHLNPKGERHHGQDEKAGDESGKFHGAAGGRRPGGRSRHGVLCCTCSGGTGQRDLASGGVFGGGWWRWRARSHGGEQLAPGGRLRGGSSFFPNPCRALSAARGLVDFPMSRLGRQWVSAVAPELMRVHF